MLDRGELTTRRSTACSLHAILDISVRNFLTKRLDSSSFENRIAETIQEGSELQSNTILN